MARGISQWAIARVDALDGPPLSTVLTYRRDQPWEVALRLLTEQNDGDGCTWLISRELLAGGLHGPTGIGDVRVAPAGPQHLRVELHNGETSSALHLRYTLVAAPCRPPAASCPTAPSPASSTSTRSATP